jgi:hypothetical protein
MGGAPGPTAALLEYTRTSNPHGLIWPHTSTHPFVSFERLRLCIATDNLSRVPHNLELFLNGWCFIIPIVINGWIYESTAFESITNHTPADHVYEDRALTVAAKMDVHSNSNASASTSTAECSRGPETRPIDLLPQGRVTLDRDVILELCARASPFATTQTVLAALHD